MIIHEKRIIEQKLIVLVGNIGLGKSTYAKSMVDKGYAIVSFDAISSALMGGITGTLHGAKYAKLCNNLYETTMYECLSTGISVIADDLNLRSNSRAFYCQMAKSFDVSAMCVDFGSGTTEGLKRRADSSDSFDYQGFDIMFQDLQNKYQKPSKAEGFDIIIKKEN